MMALKPAHPNFDAWLVTQLLIVLFHHYAYATLDEPLEQIAERLWQFRLAALGGSPLG